MVVILSALRGPKDLGEPRASEPVLRERERPKNAFGSLPYTGSLFHSMAASQSRTPRWYGIPLRVLLVTLIGTLLCFAVSLLLAIVGTVGISVLHHAHPDMRIAYRLIALPMALVVGGIIFVFSIVMEVRHYRQMKTLSAIERMY